jgi:hypothetical protein
MESMDYAAHKLGAQRPRLPLGRRRVCCWSWRGWKEPSSEAIHAPNSTAALPARLMPHSRSHDWKTPPASRGESAKRLPPSLNGISRFRAPEWARLRKNYRQFS